MKIPRGERKKARIEMIPLIDITFLLLSFFIYVSLFMVLQRGIPVRLPHAQSYEQNRASAIEVTLDAEGNLLVGDDPTDLENLGSLLESRAKSLGVDRVVLRGDGRVPYDLVVKVLDRIRLSGMGKVSLETRAPEAR
ncbi:MAG: ExbD/TolR family protein [Thermodesulfobacteriota bacterium]